MVFLQFLFVYSQILVFVNLVKRNVYILGLFCSFLATFSYDIFTSVYSLILARILHGIGFGLSTTFAAALVADVIPAQRRGEGIGLFWLR